MQLTPLLFIRETEKARLYTSAEWKDLWIPKSVIRGTIKIPSADPLEYDTHIVTVEEWWYDKITGVDNSEDDPTKEELYDLPGWGNEFD